MAKIRRVDFYPDDMLGGVSGKLTPAQLGVYWMVCTLIYAKGGPIDNDHKWLANCLGGCNPRTVTAALDQLRTMGKIEVNGDRIEVERCMNELRRTGERIAKNSEASAKGVDKRRENKELPQSNGDDSRNPNSQQPAPAATPSDIITEIPKPRAAPRRRNTVPDDDWKPSDKLTAELKSKGWTQEQIDRQTRKRVDYCRANGKTYADHDAAFRNWMNGPFQNERPGQQAPPPPPGRMTPFERDCQRLDEWAASFVQQPPVTAMDEGGPIIDHEPTDYIGQ